MDIATYDGGSDFSASRDHIIPTLIGHNARGKQRKLKNHALENIKLAHRWCNSRRGAALMDSWDRKSHRAQMCEHFGTRRLKLFEAKYSAMWHTLNKEIHTLPCKSQLIESL